MSFFMSDAIGPRSKGGAPIGTVMEGDTRKLEEALDKGEGRATLKMKRDGQAVVEDVVSRCGVGVASLTAVINDPPSHDIYPL